MAVLRPAKPKRKMLPRVAGDVMTSFRPRRMSEARLKREYVDSPLFCLPNMAVSWLVRVNVKTGGSCPLSLDLPNALWCEVHLSSGNREYIRCSFAAAKRLNKLQRDVWELFSCRNSHYVNSCS